MADLLERGKEEVARLESLDTGKRIIESRYIVDVYRHFGARHSGPRPSLSPGLAR